MNTTPIWNVALVSGDAAGRPGLEALLGATGYRLLLRASLGSPAAFWRLAPELLWSLDELLVHPASLEGGLEAGMLFIGQVRHMMPRVRVRALVSPHAGASARGRLGAADCVDYGAPLVALSQALDAVRLEALMQSMRAGEAYGTAVMASRPSRRGRPALTRGEWRVLAGTLAGFSVGDQARRTGRSMKTVYALRATGLHKLGMARVDELLLYPGAALQVRCAQYGNPFPCGAAAAAPPV